MGISLSKRAVLRPGSFGKPGRRRYFLTQLVSPVPEAQRLVPSEKVEQRKPARQSASPEQVPHSSVEAQDESAPIRRAATRASALFGVNRDKDIVNVADSGRLSQSERIAGLQ
jgi:hypothetical protein